MSSLALREDKEGTDDRTAYSGDTFESDILKNIIRETWKEEMGKKGAKDLMFELDEHATAMRRLLNTYDYEIISMPVIVSNSMHMTHEERRAYLLQLEAIAIGYGTLLGNDLTNLIMLGLPKKAKDLKGAMHYTSMLIKDIEKRHVKYRGRLTKESRLLDFISRNLAAQDSGILRFLRGRRITVLKTKVSKKSSKINKLETKAARYSYLLEKVKSKAASASPRP